MNFALKMMSFVSQMRLLVLDGSTVSYYELGAWINPFPTDRFSTISDRLRPFFERLSAVL